ncbi:hypothetical protein G0Q06_04580 [Puniceicoccales bacterium CK1056]|uniref:Uncharacterized protein n=1 Tax=Oceanipulchritudo coccoides TaxID=2706888 RepID=A0A6B2LYN0_9BACT|nr:hypothetical protein [Oceanipulchritudo coccoides]NDV61718.1 hypothetical protein [Oceanipulchritudo coccoides]
MKKRAKTFKSYAALAAFIAPLAVSATILDINTFVVMGAREATLSGATTSGASLLYLDNSVSGRNDTGMAAVINSGNRPPFTQLGDKMTYSFNLSGITAQNNQFTPVFRVGFDFGDTATLRYATSTGTGPRLEFGSNTNGNPFSSGTVHITYEDWVSRSPEDYISLRFDDGNNIDATVTLELVAFNGSNYDYQMSVTYQDATFPSITNTKTYTFTNVNGNQVLSLFHLTNSSGMIAGDAYTISNASLDFTAAGTTLPTPEIQIAIVGSDVQVSVDASASSVNYQLLKSTSDLTSGSFGAVGSPQAGNDGTLVLTDTGGLPGTGNKAFYKVESSN